MYDSDASEDTVDRGVVGDPSLEDVFESVFLPQGVWYATHHSLEDQSGCSRMVQNACLWLSTDGA